MDFKKLIQKFKELGLNKQLTNIVIVILVGVLIIIAASTFKDVSSVTTGSTGNQQNKAGNVASSNQANNTTSSDGASGTSDDSAYENDQETKLKSLLEEMQGVGHVQVIIHFEKGEEEIPAYNKTTSSSITNENDSTGGKRTIEQNSTGSNVVLTTDGSNTKPLIVDKYKPKVSGVSIIAEGADDSDIKLNITNCVSELYDVPMNKVSVNPMKK